ncbi:IclR family transcriptional regulator [Nonomuraea sp. NPDC026600]|uniref:IclR family transcriptional regulator n=1 Tax=Nonomuraea sp. NPDC026600 TaxID=3155363 RepID=UPI0033C0A1B0
MQSVLNALRVLEQVSAHQPAGLSDLTRRLGLPKSTVQRCLLTLAEAGWIRADAAGRWELTSHAFSVGARAVDAGNLRTLAMPALNDLQATTGETIHLMVPDGDRMVLIERIDSHHQLRTVYALGSRSPMHASANGKAYLATLPDDQLARYLAQDLVAATRHSLTDSAGLRHDLRVVRERGYAVADEELAVGIIAVAAPIGPPGQVAMATLSISAPKVRLTDDLAEPYGHLVRDAAARITSLIPEPASG